MKKILITILTICLISTFTGCGNPTQPTANDENTSNEEFIQDASIPVNVTALNGSTGMGMAYLNKQSDIGKTKYRYNITYASAPDEITGQLIGGNIDIAAVPVNLASVLFNKTDGEILTCAVNTLGVLYIVEKGDTIKQLSDLAGKTIIASGKGSTPEYILNHILDYNGLLEKVNVEYVAEHDEAVSALATGNADLIMIPEPKVTAAKAKIEGSHIALDLTAQWNTLHHASLVQGVIVVRKSFAKEHPDIVDAFLKEYEASVNFTNEKQKEAATLIAEYGIIPNEQMALAAIPNCHIVYMDGDKMHQTVDDMLKILFNANPQSIGGKLPSMDIYYK